MSTAELFVTGRILDPDGHPLAGARALASDWRADPDSSESEEVQLEAHTDATGRFRLGPFLGQQNGVELKVWVEPGEATGAAADLARLHVEEVAYLLHPESPRAAMSRAGSASPHYHQEGTDCTPDTRR